MPGGTRRMGTVPLARAHSAGDDPAPRDACSRPSGSGGRSSSLEPRGPDLLAGPLPRPFERDEVVRGLRAFRRPDLNELLDREPALAQQRDQLPVREMELHRVVVGPLDPAETEVGPLEA